MTYLYDVINRSKQGMWVAAEDRVDAAIIAHDLKHTHEIENAQVEGPLPVESVGLQALLVASRRGHLGYENPRWFFIKEFDCAPLPDRS